MLKAFYFLTPEFTKKVCIFVSVEKKLNLLKKLLIIIYQLFTPNL